MLVMVDDVVLFCFVLFCFCFVFVLFLFCFCFCLASYIPVRFKLG